ncbi:predicted protein [Arabidopsis lyrata subsp. lyrata]|uniref:Predicted protein n=1 Tax=Arabidopsis lyrata subsp. lyrata TaxID=81972 RepID=D7LBK2_ARALL|nr:predicted protein [Arabidopsis lyrata subsp. lyrata]
MRIEEIDDGVAEESITLVHKAEQDPAEGLRQDPAEEDPANAQYTARVKERCSLYGCNQVILRGSWYCCPNHENISKDFLALKSAYIIVDGFFGTNITKNQEKNQCNSGDSVGHT